ncbi:kinase-like protein [Neoconidiobolus thromboides FSU 785]|nr:kinase-like protein [Neoconidiobolus thromboides FSU 785]
MSLTAGFKNFDSDNKDKKISIPPSKSYYRAMANLGKSFSNSIDNPPCLISELEKKSQPNKVSFGIDSLNDNLNSLTLNDSPIEYISPELSFSPTESVISAGEPSHPNDIESPTIHNIASPPPRPIRRAKTTVSPFPQPKALKKTNSYKPITSSSYNSLPTSDAVSFLSSFADRTAEEISAVSPDEEGEEVGKYVMGKMIAKGAFSTVREAYTMSDVDHQFEMFACKVVKKCSTQKCEEKVIEAENEVMLWKQLDHPHILKFTDIIDTSYALFIFMELCPNGTLLDYVTSKGKLEEDEARIFFNQLLQAVRYLHQDAHIIHRDLKLENIVLTSTNHVKLTDFGLSVFKKAQDQGLKSPGQGCAGSINYCAPELLRNTCRVNDYCSDIWSLGVILYTLVVGKFPFSDGFEPRLIMKICNGKFDLPDALSPPLKELISSMLSIDSINRPNINEVIGSTWCQESS